MSENREIFVQMMDDLATELGTELRFGKDGTSWIVPLFGEAVSVNISYRPETDKVVAYALVEALEDVPAAEARARALLAMTAFNVGTHGFTLGVDPDTRDLVAFGRRAAGRFEDLSALSNWICDLGELAQSLRLALTDVEDATPVSGEREGDGE